MKTETNLRTIFLSLALVTLATASVASAQNTSAKSPDFFEEKIRPVLIKNCYSCHTTSAMGGLRLDSEDAMKTGGKRGAAVVPGKPDDSVLLHAIQQTDPLLKMPL